MSPYIEEPEPRSGLHLEEPEPTSGLGKKGLEGPFLTLAFWLLVMMIMLKVLCRRPVVLPGAVSFAVGAAGLVLLPEWRHVRWLRLVLGAFPIIVRWPDLRNFVMLRWRFTYREFFVWVVHHLRDALYG